MKELTEASTLHCANCNTPMQGEFCHHCGQSIHSVLKPMHHMAEDAMDMVLHVDGRIVHTLPPLLLKPGFLTLEYFSGRRQRYVAPFRLMFVLCLLAFFTFHLAVGDEGRWLGRHAVVVHTDAFDQARTPQEVEQALAVQLAKLDQARHVPVVTPVIDHAQDEARLQLVRAAMKRRLELGDKTAVLPDKLEASPAETPGDAGQAAPASRHSGRPSWLPDFVAQWLKRAGEHIGANIEAFKGDGAGAAQARERLVGQTFAALPQTMFFMLPMFALLLKLVYLFRRRLYMEHLIVALHSHAFMFLALLLGLLLYLLKAWLTPHAGWIGAPFRWLEWTLALWVPTYLLVMQKRIYRQGWTITVLKYLFVGWCYLWLLLVALLLAFALGFSH